MNQKQYALERVDRIATRKIDKLKEKYTRKGKTLTDKERYCLIRDGKVPVRSEKEFDKFSYHQNEVTSVFVFSKYEWAATLNTKEYNPRKDKIIEELQRIQDQIMLGDAAEALGLIQKFKSFDEV